MQFPNLTCPKHELRTFPFSYGLLHLSSCRWLRPNTLGSCFTSTSNLSANSLGHLFNIPRICRLLTMSTVSTLVKTIIAIHLDYCRSPLSPNFRPCTPYPMHTQSHFCTQQVILLKVILHQVTS